MKKKITTDLKVRKKLKKGVDKLADAVKITLGAKGNTVVIERNVGNNELVPIITKDGVTVAKEINLKDPIENMGCQMVKEVASKTNDLAGDGTTTATILAQAIVSEGTKNITAGANPLDLKKGIDKAVKVIVKNLKENSKKVELNDETLVQVATISANNDKEIGGIIASAFNKIGKEGVITLEEGTGTETYVDVVEGMQLDSGFISPYFITDMEKQVAVLDNPYILIYNDKINSLRDIIGILEVIAKEQKSLLIIADDVTDEALSVLLANKTQAGLKVAAIKAPSFGLKRKALLNDIAIITNGQEIVRENGMQLEHADINTFGRCKKVIISKDSTTIVDGGGDNGSIENHIKNLKSQSENITKADDKQFMQTRIAKITGGVAIMYVGAISEVELKEKYDRVEDALNATKASLQEGVVLGGGVALIKAVQELQVEIEADDEAIGVRIVEKAVTMPLKQIAINGGISGEVVYNEVLKRKGNIGYDVKHNKYVDMHEAGIIDPTKVTRVALENAASVAGMILTTQCSITNIK